MTTLVEGPMASEGSSDEWLSEQASLRELATSTAWVDWMKAEERRILARERRTAQYEQNRRAREDAEQAAQRELIRRENEAEAARILAAACPSCFCVHAGEC